MTEIRLTAEGRARLRAIAEQATSGPWVIQGVQSDYEIIGAITESQNGGSVGTRVLTLSSRVPMPAPDDVAHIVVFHPQTALALLDQVDALELALREVLDACDGEYVTDIGPIVRARAVLGLPKGEPTYE